MQQAHAKAAEFHENAAKSHKAAHEHTEVAQGKSTAKK